MNILISGKYYFLFIILSLALPAAIISAQEDVIHIARFDQTRSVAFSGWQIKEWKGRADVSIINTDEVGSVLALRSKGTSTAIYKDIELDIKDIPYLNWQWKVTELPEGGDVRNSSTDDQAAQIYVIFPKFPKFPSQINSRVIGYIWDTNAPRGSIVTSTKFSKTKYIVLKSGQNGLGKWFAEKRNIYEDYKMLFNEEPPKAGKISVMIDSDDTKSQAESFFGDIYLSAN